MNTSTLTIQRHDTTQQGWVHIAITVALVNGPNGWNISEAIDEDGNAVKLDHTEISAVMARAAAGEDETGR